MQKFNDIALIVNAKSRKGKHWKDQIDPLCEELGIDVSRRHYANDNESFQHALRAETEANPDLLIVGGGDGTVHSVINHIDLAKTTIAVIPLGTVNNFARSLQIGSRDIKDSMKAIIGGHTKLIHLGKVNGHHFTNLSAIGVSVKVAQNVSNKSKRILGRLAYYLQGIYEILTHKSFLCELEVDDNAVQKFHTHQIVVAKGKFKGLVRFTPGASVDSGHITVIIFGRTKRRLVHLKNILYFIFPGWVRAQPLAISGSRIRISTKPCRAIEVDGEAVSQTPAEFTIEKDALRVIYKARSN